MKTAGCWIAEGGDQGMFKNGPLNDQSNEITLGSVICFGPRKPRVSNKTQYSESYMMQIFIALSAIYMRSLHYANSSTNTTYSAWKQIA